MVPEEHDTSYACDFQTAHLCGYTLDSDASSVSRKLIQQHNYLVIGAKDARKATILLSPVSTISEDTCLQIYLYCKECWNNGDEAPILIIEYVLDDVVSKCLWFSGEILPSQGSVIELPLDTGTSRLIMTIFIPRGWLLIHRIDATPGECSYNGKLKLENIV